MKSKQKSVYAVYALSLVTNLLIVYVIYAQFNGVQSLTRLWNDNATGNLTSATTLAEIERNLGYVGFIHHFKNYVIRGTEEYYEKAELSYQHTSNAITAFKQLPINDDEHQVIAIIEKTLNDYHQKLQLIHSVSDEFSITELDQKVKIDDAPAEQALNTLRSHILPRLKQQQAIADDMAVGLNIKSIYLASLLIPTILISSLITIRVFRRLDATSKELVTIFDLSPDAIIYTDIDGNILKANKATANMFGYTIEEIQSLQLEDLIEEHLRDKHRSLRTGFSQKEQSRPMAGRELKIQGVRKDQSLIELSIDIAAKTIDGDIRSVCVVKDITHQNQLKMAAEKDHLTQLGNRRFFDQTLNTELSRKHRERTPLSLLMIDLDHFKLLNDNEGHVAGDIALKKVADYLQQQTRSYDHLARWGGDEFVLLCPGLSREDAIHHAERIRAGFEGMPMDGNIRLTLSIGVASACEESSTTSEDLLNSADKAVYNVKNNGRNHVKHHDHI
ncbi:MAG: hypothetical protein AseanaTS_13150 [Candidatus Pelagadaptatus aseana]|uniref:GGDEF domain-containing protein n=1 Tax=Candidatus Pelagadaptatus aseana TaxID=3120508 RepID=UPI0039B2094E